MKKASKILRCSCKHPWQDSRYGNGLRVFNRTKLDRGSSGTVESSYKCTVCNSYKWSK